MLPSASKDALRVPRIQGQAVDLHPALIMLILVIASEAAGLFGVILAVPVAALARDIFLYFYRGWSVEAAQGLKLKAEG